MVSETTKEFDELRQKVEEKLRVKTEKEDMSCFREHEPCCDKTLKHCIGSPIPPCHLIEECKERQKVVEKYQYL